MRLRSFIVRDMAEAMTLVRREMGPDAIIVTTRATEGGNLEVRAAVEAKPSGGAELDPDAASRGPLGAAGLEPESLGRIGAILSAHGVEGEMADSLGRAADSLDEDSPVAALALALETRFRFRPVSAALDGAVVLIGPAGAGKTSAAAKLAARAALNGESARLVCADWARAAAPDQLRRYAEATRAAFDVAEDLDALARIVDVAGEDEFVIVDAPAANLYDRRDVAAMVDLIDAAGADPVLVIDSGMAREEASMLARRAGELGASRAIASKLDAVRGRGALVSLARPGGLAYAQFSATPYLGGGFAPATPLRLARFLLEDPSGGESDLVWEEETAA